MHNTANSLSVFQENISINTDSSLTSVNPTSAPSHTVYHRRHRRSGQVETPMLIVEGPEVQVKINDVTNDVEKTTTSLKQHSNESLTINNRKQSDTSSKHDSATNIETNARYRNVDQALEIIRRELVSFIRSYV